MARVNYGSNNFGTDWIRKQASQNKARSNAGRYDKMQTTPTRAQYKPDIGEREEQFRLQSTFKQRSNIRLAPRATYRQAQISEPGGVGQNRLPAVPNPRTMNQDQLRNYNALENIEFDWLVRAMLYDNPRHYGKLGAGFPTTSSGNGNNNNGWGGYSGYPNGYTGYGGGGGGGGGSYSPSWVADLWTWKI